MKLRNQILGSLILSGLLPLALAFLYAIWHSSITTNTLVTQTVESSLGESAAKLSNYFTARETEMSLLARFPAVKSMKFNEMRPFLMETLDFKGTRYEKFIIGHTNGSFHNTAGGNRFVNMLRTDNDHEPFSQPKTIAQRDYWQATIGNNKLAESRVYISNPMISYTTEVKQVVIAATIIDELKVKGLIGGSLPWNNIQLLVNEIQEGFKVKYGSLAKLAMLSGDGTYWYHWQSDKVIHFKRDENNQFILNGLGEKQTESTNLMDEFKSIPVDELNAVMRGEQAHIINTVLSEKKHHIFKPIGKTGYILQLTVDEKVLTSPTSKLSNVLFLTLITACLAALVSAIFLSKKLTFPLYDFARKINQVQSDTLAPIPYSTTTKEFSLLFLELNNMIININDNDLLLRTSEERFSMAMKGANDGLWDWNLLTDDVYFSPRWKEMLGYEDNELANHADTWKNLIFEDDTQAALYYTDEFLAGKVKNYRHEFRMKHKSGRLVNILSRAFAFRDPNTNKVLRLVGTHIDITDRKNQEYQLHETNTLLEDRVQERTSQLANLNTKLIKAMQTAELANKTKSLFLANMSHEIRTPMNGIVGLLELTMRTELSEQQKEYLYQLKISSDNLMHILNDILDLSKIEAGKLAVECRSFHFRDMVANVVKIFEPKIYEKHLTLSVNIAENVADFVLGDSVRCSQILSNLLNNAIKFTEIGGITIEVSNVMSTDYIEVKITDTGIGISEEQQERLFSSFMQADDSTSRKYGGTGLGLAICKRLIKLMGGDIHIVSNQNKGSCFSFTLSLPRDHQAKAKSTNSFDKGEQQNKSYISEVLLNKTALLVEDTRINRLIAKEVLSQAGMKVSTAENGLQALEMAEQHEYDVIVMDIQMPIMDGYESTQKIRLLPQHLKTPIVAMTANAMSDDKERSLAVGMNSHLTKPIQADDVIAELSRFFT
jgi:PAS domain S-box-containing protein